MLKTGAVRAAGLVVLLASLWPQASSAASPDHANKVSGFRGKATGEIRYAKNTPICITATDTSPAKSRFSVDDRSLLSIEGSVGNAVLKTLSKNGAVLSKVDHPGGYLYYSRNPETRRILPECEVNSSRIDIDVRISVGEKGNRYALEVEFVQDKARYQYQIVRPNPATWPGDMPGLAFRPSSIKADILNMAVQGADKIVPLPTK